MNGTPDHRDEATEPSSPEVLALCGGIGGAKLALGLYRILADDALCVICNPGDDFEHLGLAIRPDFDTVLYTLAGRADPIKGWGLADETWSFMATMRMLGGEDWFALGDGDLAIHVERTRRLAAGHAPTRIAQAFTSRLGVKAALVPVSDEPVRTVVLSDRGELQFQHYFVRERCEPRVLGFRYAGAETARMTPYVSKVLTRDDLRAIVVCPSNPFISIDPILSVPGMREALRSSPVPVIAVSPVVAGKAIKGPTAKMLDELGMRVDPETVAEHYADFVDGFILDHSDSMLAGDIARRCGLRTHVCNSIMTSLRDREQLAEQVLSFADRVREAQG